MKKSEKRRTRLIELAFALVLGVGLGMGSVQAQTIVNVGGAGIIGDEVLPTNTLPKLSNWTASGGDGGLKFSYLDSPAAVVANTGAVTLTFTHRYSFEADFDGGAVYVNVNNAGFVKVPLTSFTSNGYNAVLNGNTVWPTGEEAFSGTSTDYAVPTLITSVADLGSLNALDSVVVQFRGGWDTNANGSNPNWEIGSVIISDSGATLLDADFSADGPSGFTATATPGSPNPWLYLTKVLRFELDASTPDADRYQPANPGDVINLNNADIRVVKLTGTYAPGTVFSLFDLSGGTTLTGTVGSLSLPGGVWDTSNLATNGTITLVTPPAPACQLGVVSLAANGGINPNTGVEWAVGDQYRLAFYTNGTTNALSNDINYYNDFATNQAWAGSVTGLQGTHWKAMVTVNTVPYLTENDSPDITVRQNTGTDNQTGGAGVGGAGGPVYVVNGTTCIARNNADIWDTWSNPFAANATLRTGTAVFYSPYLTQNGVQTDTPDANHGRDIWTGCNQNGNEINALGTATDVASATRGSSNANTTGRVWQRFTDTKTSLRSLYAISVPLTIVDLNETTAPALVSVTDDQGATVAKLGVDSIVYTVTFSEPMDAATITPADFSVTGSATATVNIVRGTLNPAVFEVTVTPTSVGTFQFQVNSGAAVEDPVGNVFTFPSASIDDNTITVISDVTPPTLASTDIVDNVSGGPVTDPATVVYTVTFSEAIDFTSVSTADFENGGTVNTTITNVTPSGANQFKVTAVTSDVLGASTLILRVKAGAVIKDLAGNDLVTGSPIADDTTISVDNLPKVVSITDGVLGGPVLADQSFYYTVVFSEAMNASTVETTDFQDIGSPGATINSITPSSKPTVFYVRVTPGGTGTIRLQVAAGAGLTDLLGNPVATGSAIPDEVTLTVNAGPSPLRKVVTYVASQTVNSGGSPVLLTFDASASDKLVVVVTGEHGNPGALGDCTAVTYDGVPLIKAVNRDAVPGTGANPATSSTDQTWNDIWYLDNPGSVHIAGAISATVGTRGSLTAFALSNTAPGVGATAVSGPASKSVELIPIYAKSMVIASHGMGGDGNTANVASVNTVAPLVETSATSNGTNNGHVTGYAPVASPVPTTYTFTGGNTIGTHTIAAEFPGAIDTSDYSAWAITYAPANLSDPNADLDGDGLTNDEERLFGLNPTSGTSVNPISVPLNPTAGTFSFTRRDPALTDYIYTVYTSTDLAVWTEDTGAVPTPGAVVDQLQTVAIQLSAGLLSEPKLFVRVMASEAPPPPPLLDVDFEANDGGFTISKLAGTDWAWGAPNSTSLGGTVNAGNGASLKCWGTDIGNPGYYVDPTTDSRLISPVINLTSVVGAKLSFAYAIDLPAGDSAVVRIFDANTNLEIVSGAFPLTITDADLNSANWQNSGPHVLPNGVPVRIVWTLTGAGAGTDDYMGWYVDDVLVVEP